MMKLFKQDKIRHAIYKGALKEENRRKGIILKEKFYDILASYQMRVEEKLNYEGYAPDNVQKAILETFREMIKEARAEEDWEAYGVLHVLIGHNRIDPNSI